jgi:type IV pilus assembly protein PilA
LAAIAIPAYQDYIARSQASEGFSLADGLKVQVADNLQGSICGTDQLTGKYASTVAIQAATIATGATPQCTVLVTYKSTGISSAIQGKTVSLLVQSNGSIKVGGSGTTTLQTKYIPKAVI